jgi:hypothetical protein
MDPNESQDPNVVARAKLPFSDVKRFDQMPEEMLGLIVMAI